MVLRYPDHTALFKGKILLNNSNKKESLIYYPVFGNYILLLFLWRI